MKTRACSHDSPASIPLNDATDKLRYYDPGKFPQVFGERPKHVFNMETIE